MVTILTMSALKIKVIISVYEVNNEILSRDSNYIVDVVM